MRCPARPLALARAALVRAVLVAGVVLAASGPVAAQADGTVRWVNAPLEDVLVEFAQVSGVDLVFAHRLVEGYRVTATWTRGDDPARMLAGLLEGTGLFASRLRARQFVIIAEPPNVPIEPDDPAAYTGTMRGWIVDADSGVPLDGAHAWLVDLGLGDVAGPDGAFAVEHLPTGEYAVRFSHVGYRPVRVNLSVYPEAPQIPPTIRLRRETIALGGATVRPRGDPSAGSGATDLAATLSPAGARQAAALPVEAGAGDLLRALDWLPGVGRAAGGGGLVVRGADPALVRTYRDGVPVLEPAHAAGLTGAFQPEALRAVRLHRGTPPVELGGGLAGVLEVEPREGRALDGPTGVAALGPIAARAFAAVPVGARVGVAGAVRHSALGWPLRGWPAAPALHAADGVLVLDPLGGTLRQGGDGEAAAYRFGDAEATLSWAPVVRQRLTVSGWVGGDRMASNGAGIDVLGRWTTALGSARYRALLGPIFLTATLYGTGHAAREDVGPPDATGRRYHAGLAEGGLRLDADRYLSLAHTVRMGVSVARRRLGATLEVEGEETTVDTEAIEGALWVQDVWRPTRDVQVEAGLRTEAFGPHVRFSPRALARWAARPERLYLRAGAGRQTQGIHRLPDGLSATAARASARWLLAGPDAPPADAWQLGGGAEWVPLLGLALSADAYARLAAGTFEPRPGAVDPADAVAPADVFVRYAPTRGRAAGVELAARAEGGPWVVGLSYALARAETRTPPATDGEVPGPWRAARYDRAHSLGVLLQRAGPRWSTAVRLDVLSGTPDGAGGRVEPTARLEVGAGYRFDALGARWDLQARAQPTAFRRTPPVAITSAPFEAAPLALAADGATLPAWPVFSLRVAW